MTWDELADYLLKVADEAGEALPEIVAEEATEYFKETFNKKGFDGNQWPAAKTAKKTGSLLVESGALVNSIQPTLISPEKVIISAGNEKVSYAQAHNEGYTGPVTIPAHTRSTRTGPQNVRSHTRQLKLPRRQFMGESKELAARMVERIETTLRNILNK